MKDDDLLRSPRVVCFVESDPSGTNSFNRSRWRRKVARLEQPNITTSDKNSFISNTKNNTDVIAVIINVNKIIVLIIIIIIIIPSSYIFLCRAGPGRHPGLRAKLFHPYKSP